MEYTYSSYINLLQKLKGNGYTPIRFCDAMETHPSPAIIRHDVDIDLQAAERMAEIENEIGVRSTYFVLLSSEYYNLFSARNNKSLKRILALGHEIGIHFDISAYGESFSLDRLGDALQREKTLLECISATEVKSFSWHIPRKDLIGLHLDVADELGLWNAYDPLFYSGYKYVSDSMMRWREPVEDYVEHKTYERLQILTHPIWYRELQDMAAGEIIEQNQKKLIEIHEEYLGTIWPGYQITQS